ncbi:hypothetical protein EMIHUDRAFT_455358, partial [Emiliania huxleyi CCMP1516]|uniref:Lipid-binding serum glycoprotein N-terminal domain-containing protein n=2 Tax=Emiliania huxleyi TaxID=2903 RepID=A0A0D3KHR4_EMIH1
MARAIALLVASSLLPLVAGQAAQQWLDTLTLHSARLVLRLSTLADGDDPVGGGQKMSIVLTEAACFNIRVGHGHGETALDSHVEFGGGAATGAAAGADGGSGSISGWTQLVVAFREVDFTCHFGRVEGFDGWTEPVGGEDGVSLQLPAAKLGIVHTLVIGDPAEEVELSVKDVAGEIALQVHVDADSIPERLSAPFAQVTPPSDRIAITVHHLLTDFIVNTFINSFGVLVQHLLSAFVTDMIAYLVEQQGTEAIQALRRLLLPQIAADRAGSEHQALPQPAGRQIIADGGRLPGAA